MKDNQLRKEYLKHKEFMSSVCFQNLFEARPGEDRSGSRLGA